VPPEFDVSRRVSVRAAALVALVAFALGMVFGRTAPRVLTGRTPPARLVLLDLPLGEILLACKPAAAVLVTPPASPAPVSARAEDEADLPFVYDVVEWDGPTDVIEVRREFLRQVRRHYDPKGLVCYGPGIDPGREGDPNLSQEILRFDTRGGVCAAMASLVIHVRGERCKVKACVMPARRWLYKH
jgi:hypothetical protein